jgi:hypothetical protein
MPQDLGELYVGMVIAYALVYLIVIRALETRATTAKLY